jgi:hypothetical protein
LLGLAASAADGASAHEYRNANWGYSVIVPAGMRYETSPPPSPNHGFRATLSRDSFVWVDGTSSDDLSLKAAADTEVRLWSARGCRTVVRHGSTLGGRPAQHIALRCPAGGELGVPGIVSLTIALNAPPGISNTAYIVGAFYPESGRDERLATAAQDALVRGFRFSQ